MALDAVDEVQRLVPMGTTNDSTTEQTVLVGGRSFTASAAGDLQERFGLDADVASHLNRSYGDRATLVAELAAKGHWARLAETHPYLEAEVLYAPATSRRGRASTC